ncbi:NUDIX domain-containing protein [Streptomyces sp. NBC_01264]|uniref:NUDIX domain-containing protein n=1 Tax=Streptomyces sp. NBC_01264 TaxID=2903804 RepID=UPI00225345E5|nr:NUDIX domain-containing protein [Streptomyces sp. NBC_01264]MCX4776784.1 NUDIX domain-containing protein [Streptomyces sp. NBC_01264]
MKPRRRTANHGRVRKGGHPELTDTTLLGGAIRELSEETGIDPGRIVPVSGLPAYVEFGQVPARPAKDEPEHYHLDIGYAFATAGAEVGCIEESSVVCCVGE